MQTKKTLIIFVLMTSMIKLFAFGGPFPETEEENMKRLFSMLYSVYPEKYELTPRFRAYVENRKALFNEVLDYRKVVEEIKCSKNFAYEKKSMIRRIDDVLNILYPYK